MSAIVGNARKVFEEFARGLESRHGGTDWSIRLDSEDCAKLGLSDAEAQGALRLLETKGLIARKTLAGAFSLTATGVDACLSPDALADHLPI